MTCYNCEVLERKMSGMELEIEKLTKKLALTQAYHTASQAEVEQLTQAKDAACENADEATDNTKLS